MLACSDGPHRQIQRYFDDKIKSGTQTGAVMMPTASTAIVG